jgi:hypothetical protein
MKKLKYLLRRFSPLIVLFLLAAITWNAQAHLGDLQQFTYPELIASTDARITQMSAPQTKKGEQMQNLRAKITLNYQVDGQKYGRVLMMQMGQEAPLPQLADSWVVHYIKAKPEISLLPHEIARIDQQIKGMQSIVLALGLATLFTPFTLIAFARRRKA